ncbi:MAG: hypothetical protein QNJ72_18195 [Pleurocapsa sp. MO_226.B13]|nr:hypothetical protein [Pleurocapsa sp. MO_226.B13]
MFRIDDLMAASQKVIRVWGGSHTGNDNESFEGILLPSISTILFTLKVAVS